MEKQLEGNTTAIGIFNSGEVACVLGFPFRMLGYKGTDTLSVKDVWEQQSRGLHRARFEPRKEMAVHETLVLHVSDPTPRTRQ